MIDSGSLNTILIPYDCIVDEDTGLLRVIRNKYSNDTVFFMDKIKTNDDIRELVLNENYNNPLELILRPDYIEKAEDFYNQFMDEEYEDILKESSITKIFEFVRSISRFKLGFINLLAKNERQKESLELLFGKDINILIGDNSIAKTIDDLDTVFLKRIEEIKKLEPLEGLNIYLLDYNFNYENGRDSENPVPKIESSLFAIKYHYVMHIVNPYIIETEEIEEEEEEI